MKGLVTCLFCGVLLAGCAGQRNDLAAVREILALAKEDKVQGRLKVSVNGLAEAGLKEGVYFGSPGSRLDADLSFRFSNVGEEKEQRVESKEQRRKNKEQ